MKRYIRASKEANFNVKLASKPWSQEEEARTDECSNKLREIMEDYGYDNIDEESDTVEYYNCYFPGIKSTDVTICKCRLAKKIYSQRGETTQPIPRTTYYTVDDDGWIIDENVVGYATLADARHAAMIYIQEELDKLEKKYGKPDRDTV